MLTRYIVLCFCMLFAFNSSAQYFQKEKELISRAERATDDSSKVIALSQLADFYYIYSHSEKGDSILNVQLRKAELSTNKNLLLFALFGNSVSNIALWSASKNFNNTLAFLDKGLNYARQSERTDYETLAYLRKATIYRKMGKYDNALQEVSLASGFVSQLKDDSLKVLIALEIGDISFANKKTTDAYRHYNRAYDLAYSIKNIPLQSLVYHRYAALYNSLDEKDLAKDNLLKSLKQNKEHANAEGIFEDYFDLARYTDIKEYFVKAVELANQSGDEKKIMRSKRLMFSYYMTVQKDCNTTFDYYSSNPDLQQAYINSGKGRYLFNLGNIYKYCGKNDSALFYFNQAITEMQGNYPRSIMKDVYGSTAECMEVIGSTSSSIAYYEKALNEARAINDVEYATKYTLSLSKLNAAIGDFNKAYAYQNSHILLKDTLHKLSEKREVVLLEVERETRKHEQDIAEANIKASRIRNLQYMGISAAIATLFIFLMLMGMFPISKMTIKVLSFIAFICLFEFFIVMIDAWLHNLAHGEPLKIWLCKIAIIALLMPIHHFLEHGMVHFLASQRLMRMRQKLSLRRWIISAKKPAPSLETGIVEKVNKVEEDAAIL